MTARVPSRHSAALRNLAVIGGIADSGEPSARQIYGFGALQFFAIVLIAWPPRDSKSEIGIKFRGVAFEAASPADARDHNFYPATSVFLRPSPRRLTSSLS